MPLACWHSFHVLTHSSLCRLQRVSAPFSVAFFLCVRSSHPLHRLESVSVPYSVAFLPYPKKFQSLPSPDGEYLPSVIFFPCPDSPSLCCLQTVSTPRSIGFFLRSESSPSLCPLQRVSTPRSITFFTSPDKPVSLLFPVCEYTLCSHFPSVSPDKSLSGPSAVSSWSVHSTRSFLSVS